MSSGVSGWKELGRTGYASWRGTGARGTAPSLLWRVTWGARGKVEGGVSWLCLAQKQEASQQDFHSRTFSTALADEEDAGEPEVMLVTSRS